MTVTAHRKALVFCVDRAEHPFALFAAHGAARSSPERDFDILICSLDPLDVPPALAKLGIRNAVLPLKPALEQASLPVKWLPLIAYLRLWLPDHFADRYDRLLYADADTRIATPLLSRLLETDLGPHPLGAVVDKAQWIRPNTPIHDFADRGIDSTRFFNSGVLLIDTANWRARDMLARMLAAKDANPNFHFHDQSLLNIALRGSFAELSPHWNWQWPQRFARFTRQKAPGIVHFTSRPKPWHAHETPTTYAPEVIAAYQEFLNAHDLPGRFTVAKPGGLRPGPARQFAVFADHYVSLPMLNRLFARFPDPLRAII